MHTLCVAHDANRWARISQRDCGKRCAAGTSAKLRLVILQCVLRRSRKSERTFRKLGSNRDLIPLYNKWFVARLPTGEKLNVAISPQLEEAFKVLNDSEGASN